MLTAPPTCHRQVKDVNTPRLFDRVRKRRGHEKKERRRKRVREWKKGSELVLSLGIHKLPAIKAVDSEPGKLP